MAEPIASELPVSTHEAAPVRAAVETPSVGKPKRRRWIGWVIALVVVLVIGVIGFFVADSLARTYAEKYVRDQIVEVLALDPQTVIEVDLGTGSLLVQAATGSIDNVTIDIEQIAFGDISGPATIVASDVPLDSSQPLERLAIKVVFSEDDVRSLAGFISGTQLTSIDLADGVINVGTEFTLVFVTVPVTMGLGVSAVDGGISFDPQTIRLGANEISVTDLRNNPLFSGLADQFLKSQDFCVASYLPTPLTIDEVKVAGNTLTVSINGDGVALGDPALSTLGTCPPG